MSLPLLALFLAAFTFGTAEFVIAGILPDVAEGLGISIPAAGYLISAYAAGIAVGGPLLVLAARRLDRKTLIVWLSVGFTLGHALCALAPGYEALLAARVFVAVLHGAFFGVAPIAATGLVPREKRGSAVALILAGLTVANVIGVPGGTAIGNALGWRATFWTVGAMGLLATLAVVALLPKGVGGERQRNGLMSEVQALGRQQVASSLAIIILVMIGQYGLFSYIAPLLEQVTGASENSVPWLLLLFGVGSTIGVLIGGRLADWKLMPSLIAILCLQGLCYLAIALGSPSLLAMIVLIPLWGGVNFAFGSPVQSRILMWAADAPNFASTLTPAAFNVGIAIGAVLGGAMLERGISYQWLPLIGCATVAISIVVAVTSLLWETRSGRLPPQPAPQAA